MSRFKEDSDYEPTDSDEDYNENEKILLEKVRKNRKTVSDSEEEVFGVGTDDDDEDHDSKSDHSDIALSDVEGQEQDDDLPDKRAWGKNKRAFYSTDYVDQDYGNVQGQQAQQAEMEEDEVNEWEKDLQQQFGDSDFFGITTTTTQNDEQDELKSTKRNKLKLSLKDSKDFFLIVQSYDEITENITNMLKPVITQYRKGQIPNCPAMDFITTLYEISMNFCTNVCMYLVLKASQIDLKKHPIIKKLNQYRQLFDQLTPTYEEIIKPQIEILLQNNVENHTVMPKKKLKILNEISKKIDGKLPEREPSTKKVKFNNDIEINDAPVDADDDKEDEEEKIDDDQNVAEFSKRPITYQIAKNKGLTPHRKKEQRNPRVKHRNKYRKAQIRRKGAVRAPRTEITRYAGEISGIKATVTKSIKIK